MVSLVNRFGVESRPDPDGKIRHTVRDLHVVISAEGRQHEADVVSICSDSVEFRSTHEFAKLDAVVVSFPANQTDPNHWRIRIESIRERAPDVYLFSGELF